MKFDHRMARLSGILYLLVIICGMFAELYVRAKLIVPDDAAGTVRNILAQPTLFRLGFVSDLVMQLSFFLLALALYQLFRNVDHRWAAGMVLSVVISVAIMCLNMLHQFAALLILEDGNLAAVFSTDQVNELVALFVEMQKYGYRIAQIFFGVWLLPLGILAYQSGFIPKVIGVMLVISCFSFLVDFCLFFLLPDYSPSLSAMVTFPTTIGEFSMCLYLLLIGFWKNNNPKNFSNI